MNAINIKQSYLSFCLTFTPAHHLPSFLHRDPKWYSSVATVHDKIDRYISNAFAQIAHDKDAQPQRYVLLHEMAKQTRDRLDLRSQILAVFMPGRDSTGFALSNVFHVLARRPDIYARLRQEVLSQAPEGTQLTFEKLKGLKYVTWVINEGNNICSPTLSHSSPSLSLSK